MAWFPPPCTMSCTQQAGLGWGRGGAWAQACPQLSTHDFLCRIKGKGPGSEVLLGPPRLPQPFVSPFPYLPAFVGWGCKTRG